mmetsp:Transcript_20753/g.58000  ORF Transcript_20753/g.58000 Transcript_20753/m.58000 type:complete len:281 (-) Transcript_20753:566-1408(-)
MALPSRAACAGVAPAVPAAGAAATLLRKAAWSTRQADLRVAVSASMPFRASSNSSRMCCNSNSLSSRTCLASARTCHSALAASSRSSFEALSCKGRLSKISSRRSQTACSAHLAYRTCCRRLRPSSTSEMVISSDWTRAADRPEAATQLRSLARASPVALPRSLARNCVASKMREISFCVSADSSRASLVKDLAFAIASRSCVAGLGSGVFDDLRSDLRPQEAARGSPSTRPRAQVPRGAVAEEGQAPMEGEGGMSGSGAACAVGLRRMALGGRPVEAAA